MCLVFLEPLHAVIECVDGHLNTRVGAFIVALWYCCKEESGRGECLGLQRGGGEERRRGEGAGRE